MEKKRKTKSGKSTNPSKPPRKPGNTPKSKSQTRPSVADECDSVDAPTLDESVAQPTEAAHSQVDDAPPPEASSAPAAEKPVPLDSDSGRFDRLRTIKSTPAQFGIVASRKLQEESLVAWNAAGRLLNGIEEWDLWLSLTRIGSFSASPIDYVFGDMIARQIMESIQILGRTLKINCMALLEGSLEITEAHTPWPPSEILDPEWYRDSSPDIQSQIGSSRTYLRHILFDCVNEWIKRLQSDPIEALGIVWSPFRSKSEWHRLSYLAEPRLKQDDSARQFVRKILEPHRVIWEQDPDNKQQVRIAVRDLHLIRPVA